MSDIHEKTQCQSISERSRTFGEAVSIGISVLVQQLGYSQTRAADAILHVITGSNCELDDDKVFAIMRRYGVSFDDATKIETVSYCYRATMNQLNLSPMETIDHLTSKLKVENLLKSIKETLKSQEQETAPSSQLTDFVQSLPTLKAAETSPLINSSSHRPPPMKPVKTRGSSRLEGPPKLLSNISAPQRQEISSSGVNDEAIEPSAEDLDVKLVEKAFTLSEQTVGNVDQTSQKVKAPSPVVSSTRTKRINNREGNEPIQPPPSKRPRTESV